MSITFSELPENHNSPLVLILPNQPLSLAYLHCFFLLTGESSPSWDRRRPHAFHIKNLVVGLLVHGWCKGEWIGLGSAVFIFWLAQSRDQNCDSSTVFPGSFLGDALVPPISLNLPLKLMALLAISLLISAAGFRLFCFHGEQKSFWGMSCCAVNKNPSVNSVEQGQYKIITVRQLFSYCHIGKWMRQKCVKPNYMMDCMAAWNINQLVDFLWQSTRRGELFVVEKWHGGEGVP